MTNENDICNWKAFNVYIEKYLASLINVLYAKTERKRERERDQQEREREREQKQREKGKYFVLLVYIIYIYIIYFVYTPILCVHTLFSAITFFGIYSVCALFHANLCTNYTLFIIQSVSFFSVYN